MLVNGDKSSHMTELQGFDDLSLGASEILERIPPEHGETISDFHDKPDEDCYKLVNASIGEGQIEEITRASELKITEIDAPLSEVGAKVLKLFVSVHGPNFSKFNLQNNSISREDLFDLFTDMKDLRSLYLQYIHVIDNEDLVDLVGRCSQLEILKVSGNHRVTPNILSHLFAEEREFSTLSLDFCTKSPPINADTENNAAPGKLKVDSLRLSGMALNDSDLRVIGKHERIRTLELALTSCTPEGVFKVMQNPSIEQLRVSHIRSKIIRNFYNFLVLRMKDHKITYSDKHLDIIRV